MHFFGKTLALWLLIFSSFATAAEEEELQHFTRTDEIYLEKAYELAQIVARDTQHTRFRGEKTWDLALLQRIVDSKQLQRDQRRELQALGIVLAKTLEKDLKLHWVIYRDEQARSRALRIDETSQVLFPITSISRRYEVGADIDIEKIYAKHQSIAKRVRDNAPLFTR
jgi:hypothetical protein